MSWKSLVTAGLLCVLASPAFAVPSLTISNGGLDGSGNWIWNVTVTPTAASTPVAVELGLRETTAGSQLLTATKNATNFDTDNPGTVIFGWETLTDVDPGAGVNNKPVGLQTNAATDEIFAALGSIDFATLQANEVVVIKTAGPIDTRLGTTLQVLGKYGTGSVNGRVAEITGASALNYSNFSGSASRTVLAGDANLSGGVTGADLATLAANFGQAGSFNWSGGDFNGSTSGTEVTGADLAILAAAFGSSGGTNTPLTINGVAGGAGSSLGSVPEPASIALFGLALLAGMGFVRRQR